MMPGRTSHKYGLSFAMFPAYVDRKFHNYREIHSLDINIISSKTVITILIKRLN